MQGHIHETLSCASGGAPLTTREHLLYRKTNTIEIRTIVTRFLLGFEGTRWFGINHHDHDRWTQRLGIPAHTHTKTYTRRGTPQVRWMLDTPAQHRDAEFSIFRSFIDSMPRRSSRLRRRPKRFREEFDSSAHGSSKGEEAGDVSDHVPSESAEDSDYVDRNGSQRSKPPKKRRSAYTAGRFPSQKKAKLHFRTMYGNVCCSCVMKRHRDRSRKSVCQRAPRQLGQGLCRYC